MTEPWEKFLGDWIFICWWLITPSSGRHHHREDTGLGRPWVSAGLILPFNVFLWYYPMYGVFPFLVIPSESFQYLLNFQQSVPSFHCAFILTQLLIAIAEKPMTGWKKEKMGNMLRTSNLRLVFMLLFACKSWVLSLECIFWERDFSFSSLTGRSVLAVNKGNSSKYIGTCLVFVLLCLSHMQEGRLQLT